MTINQYNKWPLGRYPEKALLVTQSKPSLFPVTLLMTARVLDGKSLAMQIRKEIAAEVAALVEQRGIVPCLAAVLVGDDPASHVYVRNKEIACEKAGIQSRLFRMPASTTTGELLELLALLNSDAKIHGILVQLPLPKLINERQVLDTVLPAKDVDAFAPENVGLISQGRPRFLPCTPHGVMQLLSRCDIETVGKEVVVVGRSDIVGKPLPSKVRAAWSNECQRDCDMLPQPIFQSGSDNQTCRYFGGCHWQSKLHHFGHG
jgi:methylenetetrahydrofolate dehydrogenase (NADP+)/methenyltetrahydrofolate cyclohydrolase